MAKNVFLNTSPEKEIGVSVAPTAIFTKPRVTLRTFAQLIWTTSLGHNSVCISWRFDHTQFYNHTQFYELLLPARIIKYILRQGGTYQTSDFLFLSSCPGSFP